MEFELVKLFSSRHSLHVLSVQTGIFRVRSVLKNDTSFLSSGGQGGFYRFKGLSRKWNNTIVLVYFHCCCCTGIPFKLFYFRIRIHMQVTAVLVAIPGTSPTEMNAEQLPRMMLTFGAGTGVAHLPHLPLSSLIGMGSMLWLAGECCLLSVTSAWTLLKAAQIKSLLLCFYSWK